MDISEFLGIKEGEKPLDRLVSDGGFCAIFRTIACIGDSLASGEFESKDQDGNKKYHDIYEYSWGQFLGRSCGSKVYNFSRGGMTAKEYIESFADINGPLLCGFFTALIVGWLTIKFLMRFISKHNFNVFVYYRIALGIIIFALYFIK